MSLSDQLKGFKKSQSANASISVKRAVPHQSQSAASAVSHISNNTRAAFESSSTDHRKKQRKAPVYSQPANTGTGSHAMSQLYNVIQFLKNCHEPQSIESIVSRSKVDVTKNPALWEKLMNNDKIEFDPRQKTFAYKPAYQIKSKEDLIHLLLSKRSEGGMDYAELQDSNSRLEKEVEDLAHLGQILVIRKDDGTPRTIFYNDRQYNMEIDSEFKKMWKETQIPDETDLPKKLEKAGLKTMDVFEKRVVAETKPKRSKGRNKRIKITNTHLAHLDLSKDYLPKK